MYRQRILHTISLEDGLWSVIRERVTDSVETITLTF